MAILTCKNHPDLRWSCKDLAITNGKYNGSRNIFFGGISTGRMYDDGSGLACMHLNMDGSLVHECSCSFSDLILAPEDSLVKRIW